MEPKKTLCKSATVIDISPSATAGLTDLVNVNSSVHAHFNQARKLYSHLFFNTFAWCLSYHLQVLRASMISYVNLQTVGVHLILRRRTVDGLRVYSGSCLFSHTLSSRLHFVSGACVCVSEPERRNNKQ